MVNQKYTLSFTAGGLFYSESVKIAELYFDMRDWPAVRAHVLDQNVLQARTVNSAERVCREVLSRLKLLTDDEQKILIEGSRQEQNHVLWLAVCQRYQFICDFAVEVLREKYLHLDLELSHVDYDAFFNGKAEWHDELEGLAESTRKKIRQVVFRMLREADLLSRHNVINPAMLTPHVAKTIHRDSPAYLHIFPVSDHEIEGWLR